MIKKKNEVVTRTYRVQKNVLTLILGVEAFLEQQPPLPLEYRKEGYKFLKKIKRERIEINIATLIKKQKQKQKTVAFILIYSFLSSGLARARLCRQITSHTWMSWAPS